MSLGMMQAMQSLLRGPGRTCRDPLFEQVSAYLGEAGGDEVGDGLAVGLAGGLGLANAGLDVTKVAKALHTNAQIHTSAGHADGSSCRFNLLCQGACCTALSLPDVSVNVTAAAVCPHAAPEHAPEQLTMRPRCTLAMCLVMAMQDWVKGLQGLDWGLLAPQWLRWGSPQLCW